MSFQVTTAFVDQFKANVFIKAQEVGGTLRETVMVDHPTGANAGYEQVSATTAVIRSSRHADTPLISTPHDKRWVTMIDYEWADLIDDMDKVKMLAELSSPYAAQAAMALGRAEDDVIIAALLGTATTGAARGSTAAFDTTNSQVAVNDHTYDSGSGDVALSVGKLIHSKRLLIQNEVDEREELHCLVNGKQLAAMLAETEVQSADYNQVKALVSGELKHYMGMNFHVVDRLLVDGSSDEKVIVWAKTGGMFAVNPDTKIRITERNDKSHATQVYASQAMACVRMEEAKVIQVLCDPT